MQSSPKIGFSRQYGLALHRHLQARIPRRAGRADTRTLGIRAVAEHMDALALWRVHHQSLHALNRWFRATDPSQWSAYLHRAGDFYLKVLVHVVADPGPDAQSLRQQARLATKLKCHRTQTKTLRRVLKLEIARRRFFQAQLKIGTRHYQRLAAESARLQEQSRTLTRQLILDQEEARKEISRDLHDDVAQILAGINVQLAGLSESTAMNDQVLRRRINQAQHLVGQSVEAVHRFARELRPALLDDLGLIPALRSFIRTLPRRNCLEIELTAFPAVEEIDTMQRTVLYRVAQEALTNVVRHARADSATLRITRRSGRVCLAVHDDGCSFKPDRALASRSSRRLGIVGMRERVEMVGGTFAIRSKPDFGTTVRATIPVHQNGKKHP